MTYVIHRSRYTVDGWQPLRPIHLDCLPQEVWDIAISAGRDMPTDADILAGCRQVYERLPAGRGCLIHGQIVVSSIERSHEGE